MRRFFETVTGGDNSSASRRQTPATPKKDASKSEEICGSSFEIINSFPKDLDHTPSQPVPIPARAGAVKYVDEDECCNSNDSIPTWSPSSSLDNDGWHVDSKYTPKSGPPSPRSAARHGAQCYRPQERPAFPVDSSKEIHTHLESKTPMTHLFLAGEAGPSSSAAPATAPTAGNLAIQALQLENESLRKEMKVFMDRLDKLTVYQERYRDIVIGECVGLNKDIDELRLQLQTLYEKIAGWDALVENVRDLQEYI